MWEKYKKQQEIVIHLDLEEQSIQESQEPEVYYVVVEKVFNSMITEIFQGSDIEELLQHMLAMIQLRIENPMLRKRQFTLDSVMYSV